MREVYAVLLRFADGADAQRARVLVRAVLQRQHGSLPADADRDRDRWLPADGVVVEWNTLYDDNSDDFLFDCTRLIPEPADATLRQRLSIIVGSDADDGWVLVRQSLQPIGTVLLETPAPPARRPEIVGIAVGRFACIDAGWRLCPTARSFGAADVAELAAFVMGTPSRMLPVVVVAEVDKGHTVLATDTLANLLVGVAHVVVVRAEAREAFLHEFGPSLGVDAGGARLYWPRWRSDDPPRRHWRWSAAEVQRGAPRPEFAQTLAGRLFAVAATHVAEPPLRNRLRAAQARTQRARIATRMQQYERLAAESAVAPGATAAGVDLTAKVDRLERRAELMESDLETVLTDYDAAVDEIEALERELRSEREDNDRLITGLADLGTAVPPTKGPRDLAAAVHEASRRSTEVIYLPEAVASAARSQARNPGKVLDKLLALDRVARRRRVGHLAGALGSELRNAGLDWAGGVGQQAARKYADRYTVRWRGEHIALGPHLKIEGSLRVYCHLAEHDSIIVVGHVGEHLPGKRDS